MGTIINPDTGEIVNQNINENTAATTELTKFVNSRAVVPESQEPEQRFRDIFDTFAGPGYTSFSGCDIIVQAFSGTTLKRFAELQTFSYSVHREKMPVRTLGRANPKGFTRGTRTIAGSMIFTVFDRNALWDILRVNRNDPPDMAGGTPLIDQIPPIDITITFQNESGHMAFMRIYGLELMDEGQTMSIDDIITENVMSYIARDITVMSPRGGEYGPDGKKFINQGIFLNGAPDDLFVEGITNTLREIGRKERLIFLSDSEGEKQVLRNDIKSLQLQLESASHLSYQVKRENVTDPLGPYSTPWSYLNLR